MGETREDQGDKVKAIDTFYPARRADDWQK